MLKPIQLRILLAELLIILAAALFAATPYMDFDPAKRLGGIEGEYHTQFTYTITWNLRERGYIPLWQPLMEMGDPTIASPFSFIMNPIATIPAIFNQVSTNNNSIKISIVLSIILTGLGGWVLGRLLGLGSLGRLLLALLCIGKGNLHAQLYPGYFQLFESQVFFPWIFAGIVGILRGYRRWPIVLTGLSFTLLFWSGIAWYPPALILVIGIIVLVYGFDIQKTPLQRIPRLIINWPIMVKVAASGAVTVGLAAITLIPLFSNRDKIGGSGIFTNFQANLMVVMNQFFSGVKNPVDNGDFPPGQYYSYYSYVLPNWFAILLIILLATVILIFFLKKDKFPILPWRFLTAAGIIFVFCTLWGAGLNPIIEILYKLIPFFSQFRHVDRVLALSSFWLAVIAAICVDGLWRYLVEQPIWAGQRWMNANQMCRMFAGGLIIVCGTASFQVIQQWHTKWDDDFVRTEDDWENNCINWLRANNPNKELSVYTTNYRNIFTYLRNNVRHAHVASDFYHAGSVPSDLYSGDLTQMPPEYMIDDDFSEHTYLKAHPEYQPMPDSPTLYTPDPVPCLYHNDTALSYAFAVSTVDLQNHPGGTLPKQFTTPITSYVRDVDRIALIASGDESQDMVVTLQERDYPGWTVQIDGNPAKLESVGGLIGVVMSRDDQPHLVYFQFKPANFYFGGDITLLTWVICVLYLLRGDVRLVRKVRPEWTFYGS